MTSLTEEQIRSIKNSYLTIVGLFFNREKIESRYLRCLLRWGFQLHLTPEDLRHANVDLPDLGLAYPVDKVEKVEALFHLVHMICLDQVVEDVELEIANIYAEKLGFDSTVISDLLKAIVTADSDGSPITDVRSQVMEFMKLHGA